MANCLGTTLLCLDDLNTLFSVLEDLSDQLVSHFLTIKNQRRLLEAKTPRLDKQEVDNNSLHGQPHINLDNVGYLQNTPTGCEEDVEQEDHSKNALGNAAWPSGSIFVETASDPSVEPRNMTRRGMWLTRREKTTPQNNPQSVSKALMRVVADKTVATPLTEETDGQDDEETVAVALGLEEREIARGIHCLILQANSSSDLLHLHCDRRVVPVTVGVVLDKQILSFSLTLLGDQPSRRLVNDETQTKLKDTGQGLQNGRDTPCPRAVHSESTVSDPGGGKSSETPECVVDGNHSNIQSQAKTKDASCSDKHACVLCSALKTNSNKHDGRSSDQRRAAAKLVAEHSAEWQSDKLSDILNCV
ncbi:hypothetical protein HG530_012512 [Fusarium avenaceum]|nr:hypothetical protein HG530_012512 [Fusarium avenaceum]